MEFARKVKARIEKTTLGEASIAIATVLCTRVESLFKTVFSTFNSGVVVHRGGLQTIRLFPLDQIGYGSNSCARPGSQRRIYSILVSGIININFSNGYFITKLNYFLFFATLKNLYIENASETAKRDDLWSIDNINPTG